MDVYPEVNQRRAHDVGVLESQLSVVQEHVDGGCDLFARQFVDGIEDPNGFGQNEMRNPGALGHEFFSGADLRSIVAGNDADQDVGINGLHAVVLCICECLLLRLAPLQSLGLWERVPDESRRS